MGRIWLRHPDTGGFFHCPADALDQWLGMGWQMSDPPPQDNPAVAEFEPLLHDTQAPTDEPEPVDEPDAEPSTRTRRSAGTKSGD